MQSPFAKKLGMAPMSTRVPNGHGTRGTARGWTVSFRTILLTVILGLILAASISTTLFGAQGLGAVIQQLLDRQIKTTLDAVTSRVESLFEPSDRLLDTFGKRIHTGTLPISDPLKVAGAFAEALEFEDGIKWIYFGYADGRFAGAMMDHGQIVLNTSSPGNLWQEWKPDPDGHLIPFHTDAHPEAFDARNRIWFQLAKDHDGMVWTPPYDYVAGQGRGLTVSKAVRSADGALIGVVGVDFLLKDVTEYLKQLKKEYQGDTLVFSIKGRILATPHEAGSDPIIGRLLAGLATPGAWEKIQRKGEPLVIKFSQQGEDYIAGVRSAVVPGDLECVSAIVFSRRQAFGAIENTIYHGILTALVALAASLVLGVFVAGRIATPLKSLALAVARIGRFDLGPNPPPHSRVREIRALSDSIDLMRSGLHSFSHYVPVDLVRNLVQSGGIAELGGERRDVTILFCDLADFTSYAETTAPEDAVKVLTRYFEEFGRAIDDNSGIIDKFLGDGMMALFNAPERVENPCACACRAALQGIAALRKKEIGFGVRIGLHCGECLIGNVGTSKRFTFTAIGDCVNLASRLEGLNKVYATQIIASSAFVQEADDTEFLWRRLDRVGVAGRTASLDIYELVDFRAEASGRVVRITESYTAALDFFLRREFSQAAEILRRPELESDKPSQLLRSRIDLEISRPPDPAWEGVNRFGEK